MTRKGYLVSASDLHKTLQVGRLKKKRFTLFVEKKSVGSENTLTVYPQKQFFLISQEPIKIF